VLKGFNRKTTTDQQRTWYCSKEIDCSSLIRCVSCHPRFSVIPTFHSCTPVRADRPSSDKKACPIPFMGSCRSTLRVAYARGTPAHTAPGQHWYCTYSDPIACDVSTSAPVGSASALRGGLSARVVLFRVTHRRLP